MDKSLLTASGGLEDEHLFLFHAMVTGRHSPATFSRPRRGNCRKPMTDLMMPKTGSTVCLRRA